MKGKRGFGESQVELIKRQRQKATKKYSVERANERAVRAGRWLGVLS